MEECIFCKIAKGKKSAVKIWEDDLCIAMLDKFPTCKGQMLIIPKKHVPYFANVEDKTYTHLFSIAKKITKAMDSSLKTMRTCLVVEGFEVAHTHIKLFPCYENKMPKESKEESDENLKKTAELIKSKLVL